MTDAELIFEQANFLQCNGRFAEAEAYYRQAYQLRSDHAETANNLGVAVAEQARLDEALTWYRRAIEINNRYDGAHYNLGNALRLLKRWDEACACYEESLRIQPGVPDVMTNLGLAHSWAGRVEQAIVNFQRAIDANPRSANALNGLGLMYQRLQRFDEAEYCFNRAVDLDPQSPFAHVNRAQLWLLHERLPDGFCEFQWRWRLPGRSVSASMPMWNGEPISGRRVLLWTEQGAGDAIMLIRFAEEVQRRGAYVLLQCPSTLHPLLRTCPFVDRVCSGSEPDLNADYHCPLFDLPRILGTTVESIPRSVPYLFADEERSYHWSSRLANLPGMKIGIAWRGNPDYPEDCHRSMPLSSFAPIAAIDNVRLLSLQFVNGKRLAVDSNAGLSLFDWTEEMDRAGAFVDTAALLPKLDLVITCDTAIGHLAGALGVPVWIALSTACDWRWFTSRTDSPWYPTVKLYRQSRLDEWHEVFARMAQDIRSTA